jgi:hypothetical protein
MSTPKGSKVLTTILSNHQRVYAKRNAAVYETFPKGL